jgi:glycosyltransferase involved in cell wall biosynthesis
MTQAILELLNDKSKRESFGKASRVLVENEFSLDAFARKAEEFYLKYF